MNCAREGELMDNCSRYRGNDLRIEDRRCNLNGFIVLPVPLTQPLPRASNFRSHFTCSCTCVDACACMWATALDAHTTNFSVMVDRVTSRFSRAEEVWILREKERGRDKLGEISGRLSRFTRRSTIFDIYTVGRQARIQTTFERSASECFIFPEE